ncbi:MAG: hypothetical protein OEU68_04095 [Nitrospira sp.]|nr:hypothetical protein [Nitrospira sp.]MDH4242685.1 hypothetical protein [Nitrospira sp.]MDH4355046.1 hypothetical protein [Nitrospira sp.]MDH5316968.1 hypothetical protein [Nitrospira sp.]
MTNSTFLNAASPGPGSAVVITFGPDGKAEAKHVAANFSRMQFAQSGAVVGGQLNFTSQKAEDQTALSASSAQFNASGKPSTLQSAINDRRTGVPYRKLAIDLSGLSYSVANRIAAGEIKFSASNAENAAKVSDGAVSFASESLAALNLTHYVSDGSGTVGGYSGINFAKAQFLGDQIVGGHVEISIKSPNNLPTSNSKLHFTSVGLPTSMHTDVYSSNGADLKASTVTDFSAAVFDPRRHIWSGQVAATTSDPQGRVKAHAVVKYTNGAPVSAKNQTFGQAGQLLASIETDFAGAQFNNRNHVVNSSIAVRCFRPDGSLLSSATVTYDASGNPASRTTHMYKADGVTPLSTIVQDYSAAVFDHHRKVVSGQVKTTITPAGCYATTRTVRLYQGSHNYSAKTVTMLDAAGAPVQTTTTVHRPDGTLAQTVTHTSSTLATVTQYGIDGKTVIKTYTVDYGAASVSNGRVIGGSLAVQSVCGDQRPLATSRLAYLS